MANSTKRKKAEQENLPQETVEKVQLRQLVNDERTHKILGSISLLTALLFFVAFTSYLFTWDEDYSVVQQEGVNLLWNSTSGVANLMGTFGAFLSHFLIYQGFGVAAYLLCTFFFILGINLVLGKQVLSLWRNLRYLIIGLPLLSVAFSAILYGQTFPWGGAVGDMEFKWLHGVFGIGSYAIVFTAFFAYLIWQLNPAFGQLFKRSAQATNDMQEPSDELLSETTDAPEIKNTKAKKTPEIISPAEDLLADEEIETAEEEELAIMVEPPVEQVKPVELSPVAQTETLSLEIKTADPDSTKKPEGAADNKPATKSYDPILDLRDYQFPSIDLLDNHGSEKIVQDPQELENNKNQIINTLGNYDITIQKISATVGPTVTLYEIIPAAGVRISKIKNLEDDIALSLAALGIRIIAPIPGKGTIGIEVPNTRKTIVSMRTLLSSERFTKNNFALPIAIGKKIDNENFIVDLASMPHLLMAGATGQGKSVGLNAILVSLLYSKHPSQLKFVLVDPKKVELSIYKAIEKHFLAKLPGEDESIITDTKKVVHTLNALCIEMDNRYDLLKEAGVRNIREYNEKFAKRVLNPEQGHQFLPFIVLVVDEFADLIMTAGKEVEMPIARLAQLARAVGIHLIIATQRPSVNIITGTIKANFPARIAFKVSSKIDSRTILDAGGADQLIGKGDMLISYGGDIVRLQCAFVDTPEVDKIVDFIGDQRGYPHAFLLPEYIDEKDAEGRDFDVNDKDPLFEDAARLIVASQQGSTSLLQRKMKLGYNRAGRLMDQLESAGVVGPSQGSKVRDVLIKTDADLQELLSRF
ncbi:MAG: DNA translocase FtsK 4TM domain-containing protein [Ferruginibacter sp.]